MGRRRIRHHLAVVRKQYLAMIASGQKRIECRILRRRLVPFQAVDTGDRVWFKQRCGPILATAKAERVRWQTLHDHRQFESIRRRYGRQICAESGFWPTEDGVWHVGLIWLKDVEVCTPIWIEKTDRRAWVVLPGPPKSARMTRPLRTPRATRQESTP